ncbi:MAG TPA: type IX secretion system sortase PorU [Bacteroidota bacterium]|nr:type IX secretion system sortase PorU [Bacteroidota bacterium]
MRTQTPLQLFPAVLVTLIALESQTALCGQALYSDVTVLESTAGSVTFAFTPKYNSGGKISADGRESETVLFDGCSPWNAKDAGKPDVRFRTIAVGVRGRTNNRVTIVDADFETVSGFSLAPVPTIVSVTPKNPTGIVYKAEPGGSGTFFPSDIVTQQVARVKGMFVNYVRIFPVQYNSATRTLKKYSRIVVKVDFGPSERTTAPASDDGWMKASLLNYTTVKGTLSTRAAAPQRVLSNSVLSTGTWFKLQVSDDGIYKIDASYLRALGMDPTTIPSMTDLKIYSGNGMILPADLSVSRPSDLTLQAADYIDVNQNGKFDSDDYILFYGQGATGWTYSPTTKQFSHYTNPYTNSNEYFLQYAPGTSGGKQMSVVSGPGNGTEISTTVGKVFFDEERTNVTESGLEWYSAPFNPNDSRIITNKLNGYVPNTIVNYKYEFLSRSDESAVFSVTETNQQLNSVFIQGDDPTTLNDGISDFANVGDGSTNVVPNLVDSRSNIKITYNDQSVTATGYINWVELTYTDSLASVNEALLFTSPDMTGPAIYDLSDFNGPNFMVFDVTDLANVKRMTTSADQRAGIYHFTDNLTSGGVKRYWAGTSAAYKTPASFVRIPNSNLHGITTGADFVIVTHHDFAAQAQRLKTFKENLPGGDALQTMVVDVDTIYNEFGNGLPDPVAIRDFLYFATTTWQTPPRYVLFFGDACYDYKNNLGLDKNWVPTYETPESNSQIDTYGYDDFYAYLQPGDLATLTLATGRLPVRTAAEADLAVDRIIQYESTPSYGSWKNLITITSDDENINGLPDGAPNPEQAESLASTYVPVSYNEKKIYEDDYPTVVAAAGRTKPAVRQAILDQVNAGTLVLNYTGHGNPKVWSHETILTEDDVINQFFNQDKLTFIVAATCDWGRFDEVGAQSSAEEALRNPRGGAIAVVSANRAVYSNENFTINANLYNYLFSTDLFARTPRLGDALMMAKNATRIIPGDEKYHLLGDPTLRLAIPKLVMAVDSINGQAVSSSTFDTLKALSKVTLSASVRDATGAIDTTVNSNSALVSVFDADRIQTDYDSEVNFTLNFLKPGAVIYNGENTVHNGRLSATFVVPKDISYENKQGKVSFYFTAAGTDGRGYTDRVVVGGTAASYANDTQGPSISIYFDTRSFRSGDLVNENPMLIVDLADSSGINSAGTGVGHNIEAWIDDDTKGIDLTGNYESAKDSYQSGTVDYQLQQLTPGHHTLQVRAWDVYNNPSTSQVDFSVASSTSLAIENVYNIPNPARSTTTFTFQHNQLSPVYAEIKIYTVSGRLIQVIPDEIYNDRFVTIFWDCRDHDGSKIANGTYFYKVIVKTVDGKFTSEALGKLSIVR